MKLVLLPGMDGTGELFADFMAAAREFVDLITVQYPRREPLDYRELEILVASACPDPEPFVLLAESFSSPVALKYASTGPPNLRGLILCAGFVISPIHGLRRLIAKWTAPYLFQLPLPTFAVKRWLLGYGATNRLVANAQSAISSVAPKVLTARLRALLRALLTCNFKDVVGEIDVPILYIQAVEDRLVDPRAVDLIKQLCPSIQVIIMNGPHLIVQSNPQRVAEAVSQFLDTTASK